MKFKAEGEYNRVENVVKVNRGANLNDVNTR